MGCRWQSTYLEKIKVWQLTELTTGRPGLSFSEFLAAYRILEFLGLKLLSHLQFFL